MSRRDDATYLRHMLKHAQTAADLSKGKDRSSLDTEPMLQYSLLHLVCILGEAANRVSATGRSKYGRLPWRDLVGMRNWSFMAMTSSIWTSFGRLSRPICLP